jgi:HEAT repeat protein
MFHQGGFTMKRFSAITLILIFALTLPATLLAKSSVQKLKDPVTKYAEYDLVVEEILNQGDQAVLDLIALLQEKITTTDPDEAKRQLGAQVCAMNLLGELKAKDALAVLKQLLENEDNLSAVYNSARTIGSIGGNNAFQILEEVFVNAGSLRYADNNEERKKAAITGMGLCENKKAIPYLIAEMNNVNSDEVTRIYAAGSLGLLGVADGLSVATSGLGSNDEYVRMAAVRALGIIGSTSSISDLTPLLDSTYVYKKNAKVAIFQIETAQLPDDKKVDFILKQLMKDPKTTELVQWGTFKLKKINTSSSKNALESMSLLEGEDFATLKQAAKVRAKTMK